MVQAGYIHTLLLANEIVRAQDRRHRGNNGAVVVQPSENVSRAGAINEPGLHHENRDDDCDDNALLERDLLGCQVRPAVSRSHHIGSYAGGQSGYDDANGAHCHSQGVGHVEEHCGGVIAGGAIGIGRGLSEEGAGNRAHRHGDGHADELTVELVLLTLSHFREVRNVQRHGCPVGNIGRQTGQVDIGKAAVLLNQGLVVANAEHVHKAVPSGVDGINAPDNQACDHNDQQRGADVLNPFDFLHAVVSYPAAHQHEDSKADQLANHHIVIAGHGDGLGLIGKEWNHNADQRGQSAAANPGLNGCPAATDDGAGDGGQFRALIAEGHPGKDGVWNAVFCAYMGVKLNGNQYDYVAKNDVDDRQHGRNAQRHQRGGQGQSGDGDREPQPEISNVFGAPSAVADFGGRQVRVIVLGVQKLRLDFRCQLIELVVAPNLCLHRFPPLSSD